ncbi:hypothetical protein ABMA28_002852 [Loxostege sticticalis]|uniref:GILT-like protein 1 n=1 Tax=Loxostege sticticalis TaxID=481309 RepID=A0ABD0SY75_LOXSC
MAGQYYLVPISLILAFSYASCVQTVNGRIKLTVGTASGCSATVRFFRDQLVPTYALYGDFLDLEFVPWGRTVKHDNGTFTCQFGPNDCWANRLHRCALNILKGNQKAQLEYMACELAPPYPAYGESSFACIQEVGINIVQADFCLNNPDLDTLDEDAQKAAVEPMAVINLVPTIVFNDNPDRDVRNQASQRLSSMVCFALADDPSSGILGCQI